MSELPSSDPPTAMVPGTQRRRIEWRLFLLLWITFAFFHQGGGWNQNGRFATIRSLAELGRLSIDSHLLYTNSQAVEGGYELKRKQLVDGHFTGLGRDVILGWTRDGQLTPVREAPEDWFVLHIDKAAATGALSLAHGSFYHRVAPGGALAGLPAYFLISGLERIAGISLDNWWVLTLNAWLTSVFSVGLVSALGCVVFFRASLLLWGADRSREALFATLALGLGTLFLPYGTMLYERNLVAVGLLAAFYGCLRAGTLPAGRSRTTALVLGGAAAGLATAAAYTALVPGLLVLGYLLAHRDRRAGAPWFAAGLTVPLVLLAGLHWVSFGSPISSVFDFEGPNFAGPGNSFLADLGSPRPVRLLVLLFSPLRGLFVYSPVLLMALAGLLRMARNREKRGEAALFVALALYFMTLAISLPGWHGGWTVGPHALIPALPFLALPLTLAFTQWFRITSALAVVSVSVFMLFTAVDPQAPVGTVGFASVPGKASWRVSPLTDYALPVFVGGQADPILEARLEALLAAFRDQIEAEGAETDTEQRRSRLEERRSELELALERREPPFTLAQYQGPVSVNPTGMYELWFGRVFRAGSPEFGWNSFNAGEFLVPRSRLSLLALLVVFILLLPGMLRRVRASQPGR